jgi:hypothetical protein
MWLADIKLEWEGRLVVPPLPVHSGGRFAITHCCCNYSTRTKQENDVARRQWERFRDPFREEWSKKFGRWPSEQEYWPGHHVRDLKHGGEPTDPNNLIPAPPDIHGVYGRQYPSCYRGEAPWNAVGPDLPYQDR